MLNKPFFLVGAERSGTTLLRLMLNHHPAIAWQEEFEYSVDLIQDNGDFVSLPYYYDYLECDRIFLASGFMIDKELDYPQLVDSFLRQKQNRDGKPIIGATVHRHFSRLLYIWKNAHFIHIIRDPRDVARSCIGMGWYGNVWYGVDNWLESELLWDKLKISIREDQYIEIHYENLIREPVLTLTEICKFMGVDYDDKMLEYEKNTTYSRPDSSLIQQWQKKMSQEEIQLVESKAGELLVKRGYQLSDFPPLEVTETMKKKLKFQNWWFKLNFRVQRFGLPLILADYLSRKLKLKSWEKQNKLKINELQTKYLK